MTWLVVKFGISHHDTSWSQCWQKRTTWHKDVKRGGKRRVSWIHAECNLWMADRLEIILERRDEEERWERKILLTKCCPTITIFPLMIRKCNIIFSLSPSSFLEIIGLFWMTSSYPNIIMAMFVNRSKKRIHSSKIINHVTGGRRKNRDGRRENDIIAIIMHKKRAKMI